MPYSLKDWNDTRDPKKVCEGALNASNGTRLSLPSLVAAVGTAVSWPPYRPLERACRLSLIGSG
jgi:hypothetical protein